jgi:hypothetical protein
MPKPADRSSFFRSCTIQPAFSSRLSISILARDSGVIAFSTLAACLLMFDEYLVEIRGCLHPIAEDSSHRPYGAT